MIAVRTLTLVGLLLVLAVVLLSWTDLGPPWSLLNSIMTHMGFAVIPILLSAGVLYLNLRGPVKVVRTLIFAAVIVFLASTVSCQSIFMYEMQKMTPQEWGDEPQLLVVFRAYELLLVVLCGYFSVMVLLGTAFVISTYKRLKKAYSKVPS